MRKWLWEMLAPLLLLTVDASSFKMAETLIQHRIVTAIYAVSVLGIGTRKKSSTSVVQL